MKANIDLIKTGKIIDEKFANIANAERSKQRALIIDYLQFLKAQYEGGSIGYITFPYFITSLMAIDEKQDQDIEKIIDIASRLEIPNVEGRIAKKERETELEALSKMIGTL